MPEFIVPEEYAPGVSRTGVGFFRPGDKITLPDKRTQPTDLLPLKLIPTDAAGEKLLEKHAKKLVERRRKAQASKGDEDAHFVVQATRKVPVEEVNEDAVPFEEEQEADIADFAAEMSGAPIEPKAKNKESRPRGGGNKATREADK